VDDCRETGVLAQVELRGWRLTTMATNTVLRKKRPNSVRESTFQIGVGVGGPQRGSRNKAQHQPEPDGGYATEHKGGSLKKISYWDLECPI
jgi:hypothetical protein